MTVDEREWLTERFQQHRSHLRAVAYRMLGSVTDAEDAVQEVWLRIASADTSGVANMRSWLTTIVGRVCLNTRRPFSVKTSSVTGGKIAAIEALIDPDRLAQLAVAIPG